jgi:hypothetical protein
MCIEELDLPAEMQMQSYNCCDSGQFSPNCRLWGLNRAHYYPAGCCTEQLMGKSNSEMTKRVDMYLLCKFNKDRPAKWSRIRNSMMTILKVDLCIVLVVLFELKPFELCQ